MTPIVFPATEWRNQDLVVYHGTTDVSADAIVSSPILVRFGKPCTGFGPGFYVTTLRWQAHSWGAQISAARVGSSPAVVELTINRDALASLDALALVRGDFDADDYWSLVHYCRQGALDHGRLRPNSGYYDVVYGPAASFWNQRMIIGGADQISFHTRAAEAVLNRSSRRRII